MFVWDTAHRTNFSSCTPKAPPPAYGPSPLPLPCRPDKEDFMLDQIKKLQAERRLYYQALIDHRDFPYIVSNYL